MATTNIKPRKKKKVVRGAPRIKRGAKLDSPSWEGWEDWTGEEFHRKSTHAVNGITTIINLQIFIQPLVHGCYNKVMSLLQKI